MKKKLLILPFLLAYILVFYSCSDEAQIYGDRPIAEGTAEKDRIANLLTGTEKIDLSFFAPNTAPVKVNAVKVGEYYWVNKNFNVEHRSGFGSTKEQIDKAHQRYVMFEHWKPSETYKDPIYWDYFTGMSKEEAVAEFNKYYGNYYWIRVGYGLKNAKMIEGKSRPESKLWKLPNEQDILQLIAMCGNATTHEIRQYLSYGSEQPDAPSVARFHKLPYHWWFNHNPNTLTKPANISGVFIPTNGFDPANTNKYGLNFVPAGSKFERPATLNTENYGKQVTFPVDRGDFNGLNQVLRIATDISVFDLHDYPEMKYEYLMEAFPVRFCRPLTDQELGYKLYINAGGSSLQKPILERTDWAQVKRYRTGEEILLADVRSGKIDPSKVDIIKLGLNENPPNGYSELPKGYIRGFYVQYMLENKNSNKTVADIIKIASYNPYLWVKR